MMAACAIATASSPANPGPRSRSGITQEVGLSLSDYKYTESAMTLTATKLGVEYSVTFPLRGDWFVKGAVRGAIGNADYRGTGAMDGVPDWYLENRWGIGRTFLVGRHTLSPQLGLGYRYLYNDLRGTTDTGAVGYRRESRYLTVRVGFSHGISLPNGARLETTIEHDRLLLGRQDTRLSDLEGHGKWRDVPDVVNYQYRGEGWRWTSVYRTGAWSIGPYLQLWRVEDSDKAHIRVSTRTGTEYWTVWEPTNNTKEFGVKASYRF
jgi:hypothetical protein